MIRRRPVRKGPAADTDRWQIFHKMGFPEVSRLMAVPESAGGFTDVEIARIEQMLAAAADREGADGPAAIARLLQDDLDRGVLPVVTRARDLPRRIARHQVSAGVVRLGFTPPDDRTPLEYHRRWMELSHHILSTSMLVVGPPGSGKTQGIARPVVESLCLSSLAERASVVVIDIKGDDFDWPEAFDVTVDLRDPHPEFGLDLFGGSTDPDVASDRLASALLPPESSSDIQYFSDSARNALFDSIYAFHAARDRYPTLTELRSVLSADASTIQSLRDRLTSKQHTEGLGILKQRQTQLGRRDDPAASMVERLRQLDRPRLRRLFDAPKKFEMADINRPTRVRVALDEGMFPEGSRFIARLVISQFVQTLSSSTVNRSIFKALVIDEAGRFIDEYVARGLQRVRSSNSGLLLLTQSLGDFPQSLRDSVFTSAGSKIAFGGMNPADAEYFSQYWGTRNVVEISSNKAANVGRSKAAGGIFGQTTTSEGTSYGSQRRTVEVPVWSVSDLINDIPVGHCVMSLAAPDGRRAPPVLVNLRA